MSTKFVCSLWKKNKYPPASISEIKNSNVIIDDLFSPVEEIESIINSDYDSTILHEIDYSDIPLAKNDIDFLMNPEFLGETLFPRQLQIAMEYFSAYCPKCSDTNWIRNKIEVDTPTDEILDRAVLYNRKGVCKKCKLSKYEIKRQKLQKRYNELVCIVGQRGGKSTLVAYLSALILYKYLTLPPAHTFFPAISKSTTLHGTFVALNFDQASDNLWQPFYGIISSSKWYSNYFKFLTEKGNELGRELFKLRDTFVLFKDKKYTMYPSGPDKRKLRGRTRFLASIDEISWFSGSKDAIKYNPDEIYDALDASLTTVLAGSKRIFPLKPYTPNAYGIYITSPASKADKGWRLLQQSKGSKTICGFHYPTWEFNPTIRKKDLSEKFRTNPIEAERNYGANPPHTISPFLSSPTSILPLFQKTKNIFGMQPHRVVKDSLESKLIAPKIIIKEAHGYPSILSIDNGYSNNSFACTLLHKQEDKIVTSGIVEIIPHPHPISYSHIFNNVIVPILENFNVVLVAFDRWESINLSRTIFENYNIDTIRYTLTYDDFCNIKTKIYSEDYIFPKPEKDITSLIDLNEDISSVVINSPVSSFFLQMLMVKDTGRYVEKGEITDDIFRAFCIGATLLEGDEHEYLFNVSKKAIFKKGAACVVLSKSNSAVSKSNRGIVTSRSLF